jgi:hypothetical protein
MHVHAKVHEHDGQQWAHPQVINGMMRRLRTVLHAVTAAAAALQRVAGSVEM